MKDNLYGIPWVKETWHEPLAEADVLFRSVSPQEGDWKMNARITNASEYAYAEGYRLAGRVVADFVIQDRWEADFLVYPIVFLYRHCVELQFKKLIPDAAALADRDIADDQKRILSSSHRLDQLWAILEPILEDRSIDIDSSSIAAIGSYVRQVSEIDKESFSFRYSITKSGDPSLDNKKLPHVNLRVFAGCMEKLTGYLDGLGAMISEHLQIKWEMEAEARQEYESAMRDYYQDGGYDGW